MRYGLIVGAHDSVDDRSAHHKHTYRKKKRWRRGRWPHSSLYIRVWRLSDQVVLTRQDLENGGKEELAAFHHSEQLVQEGKECAEAEDAGEDHEGLHGLDPVWE